MNISIVSKHIDLTDALKGHIENQLHQLEKYHLDIVGVRAIASSAEKNGKKGFEIEFVIQLGGRDSVVIRQHDKDLYAAIDLATERAKKALRRYHDKLKNHKHEKPVVPALVVETEEASDEIVEMALDGKPMTIEEAAAQLRSSDELFVVFHDPDGEMRILFKRKDGKLGLY